jgi:hypothetical protein
MTSCLPRQVLAPLVGVALMGAACGGDPGPLTAGSGEPAPVTTVPGHDADDVPGHDADDVPGHDADDVPRHDADDVPRHDADDVPGHDADDVAVAAVSVGQALDLVDGTPVGVEGFVLGDGAGYRICAEILQDPPRCGGAVVTVTDAGALLGQVAAALTVDGDLAWSDRAVVVWGHRHGPDGLRPDPAAGGPEPLGADNDFGY